MAKIEATDRRSGYAAWTRVKLNSGERVLISMAETGILVMKMALFGALPIWKVWSCDTLQMHEFFPYDIEADIDHIDYVVAIALKARSTVELRQMLRAAISN